MPEKDGARITPPSVRGFPPENDEKGRFLRNRPFFARLFAVSVPFGLLCAFSLFADFSEFFFTTGRPSVPVFPFPALTVPRASFLLSPQFFLFSPLSFCSSVVPPSLRCPSVPTLSVSLPESAVFSCLPPFAFSSCLRTFSVSPSFFRFFAGFSAVSARRPSAFLLFFVLLLTFPHKYAILKKSEEEIL